MSKRFIFEITQEDGWYVAVCHDPELATQSERKEDLMSMATEACKCYLGIPASFRISFVWK